MSERRHYLQTRRRMLLDMHIPDFEDDFLAEYEPEELAERYAAAGVEGVLLYCKSHIGLAYWPSPVGGVHAKAKGRDLVAELCDHLRDHGIAPAAYHTVVFDNWAVENHPDWAIVPATTLEGYDDHLHGPRYGTVCPNNPDYLAYEHEQISALLETHDFDALFIDMTFWTAVCICRRCQRRCLDETGHPIPGRVDWSDPAWAAFQAARERWLKEMVVGIFDLVRAVAPEVAVTHNIGPGTHGWFTGQQLDWCNLDDYASGDIYGGRDEQMLISRLMQHLGHQQPAEFMTTRTLNLANHTALKSEHMMLTEALGTLAHNGAFLFIDAIDPRGTTSPGVYERVGRVFRELAKHEYDLGGQPVEDVLVYYSDDSRVFPGDDGERLQDVHDRKPELPHLQAVARATTLLQRAHIPFGVVTRSNLSLLDRCRVLVLPDVIRMDRGEVDAVRAFVAAGGRLYASGRTSLLATTGGPKNRFALKDLFGVRLDPRTPQEEGAGVYLRATSPVATQATLPEGYLGHGFVPSLDDTRRPALGLPRIVAATPDLEVLATLTLPYGYPAAGDLRRRDFASIHSSPPWQDLDNPVVVGRTVGEGRCIYSAVPIEVGPTEADAKLFVGLVRDLLDGAETLAADTHPDVWITVYDQPDRHRIVVNALNYRVDAPAAPVDLALRYRIPEGLRVVGTTDLTTSAPLQATVDNRSVEVEAFQLDLFAMIAIDYEPVS